MKKLKKIVSLLTAVAICALLPGFNTMTVQAEGPTTFYIKYVSNDEMSEWRYQTGAIAWNENASNSHLFYLGDHIKDGDVVIVDGNAIKTPLKIPAHLSNLTLVQNTSVVVTTNGVDECFVHKNNVSAVNGDINTAYVLNNAGVTFNNNVQNLFVSDTSGIHCVVSVGGTVGHLNGTDVDKTYYDYYNFQAGTLSIKDGKVLTDAQYYSTTPTNAPANTPAQGSQSSNSGDYDDVPKTGESNMIYYLLGVAALCLMGRAYIKKSL